MIVAIIFGIVGIVFVVLGLLMWKKEMISLLHDYHYDKVKEEDKKIFCTISGVGVTTIGIGMLVTAVVGGIIDSPLSMIPFAVGFIVGLGCLIYAGAKYNR